MKRLLPVMFATLLSVAACSKPDETASPQNNAEMMADALEAKADNLEALAEANANASVATMLDGAAANVADRVDDVRDVDESAANVR